MKHITIVPSSNDEIADAMIATITSNNFGDQIVSYRVYTESVDDRSIKYMGYNSVACELNHEGCHESDKAIIETGLRLWNKLNKVG